MLRPRGHRRMRRQVMTSSGLRWHGAMMSLPVAPALGRRFGEVTGWLARRSSSPDRKQRTLISSPSVAATGMSARTDFTRREPDRQCVAYSRDQQIARHCALRSYRSPAQASGTMLKVRCTKIAGAQTHQYAVFPTSFNTGYSPAFCHGSSKAPRSSSRTAGRQLACGMNRVVVRGGASRPGRQRFAPARGRKA